MASKANSEPENGFFQQVYDIVAQIPKGQALSYGQIAQMLGRPRAARMVGWAMRRCPEELPWHRVVKADGSIAGGGQSELRRALLEGDGESIQATLLQKGKETAVTLQLPGMTREERDIVLAGCLINYYNTEN